jgi:iron(III) transport system permease protein
MQAKQLAGMNNMVMHAGIYLLVFLSIIPQITVTYTSFLKTNGSMFVAGFSFESYETIFANLGSAITNTYVYSFIAIFIIVFFGMLVAYITTRRKSWLTEMIDTLTMFPYIIPGSVLGITLLLAFNEDPMILSGTAAIIIISLVIRRLPYTLRSSSAILYQISPSVEEASISLGASPLKTFFKITAVMMIPGVLSGAILSWITCISELSSSVILYTGETKTMSVAIYTEVIRASYGTAAALSTILTITTIAALLLFFRVSGNKDISL